MSKLFTKFSFENFTFNYLSILNLFQTCKRVYKNIQCLFPPDNVNHGTKSSKVTEHINSRAAFKIKYNDIVREPESIYQLSLYSFRR